MIQQKIYNQLREAIVFGKLAPGERLIETELSQKYGTSRGPVREVFARLASEGFITLRPNKGATVAKISSDDLRDLFSLVAILESKAIELATPQMGDEDVTALAGINDILKECLAHKTEKQVRTWTKKNLDFHRYFWQRCGNAKMEWLVEELRLRVFRYRFSSFILTARMEYLEHHEDIVRAIRRKDAQQAGQLMNKHIFRSLEILMDYFDNLPNL